MHTIKTILKKLGVESVEDMDMNESYTIESDSDSIMDLTIEKVGRDLLSVGQYHRQRGDLMADPEVVFDTSGDEWTPLEYKQDPGIHQYDEDGLEISDFLKMWNSNLKSQKFIQRAEER